jgi:hypothetical protein
MKTPDFIRFRRFPSLHLIPHFTLKLVQRCVHIVNQNLEALVGWLSRYAHRATLSWTRLSG